MTVTRLVVTLAKYYIIKKQDCICIEEADTKLCTQINNSG